MPEIKEHWAVSPKRLAGVPAWQPMRRIDTVSASIETIGNALSDPLLERSVYAEGDSWFDKFTPISATGTNLLEAIRTLFRTAVVDVSHIGDEVRSMVSGWQARQTKEAFRFFRFNAILLSAGGNDLKNLFVARFDRKAARETALEADIDRLATPASYREFFADVMSNIKRFVDLRNNAGDATTKSAPTLVHGYDYLQPRPAGAVVFQGTRIGRGPWLYPSLRDAGLDDRQMRSVCDAIIDEMNVQLIEVIAPLNNVHVINQRGLLRPAAAGTATSNAHWMDEIHPNAEGFVRLARNRWDVPLSRLLGWVSRAGDLVAAEPVLNTSTALVGSEPGIA